MSIAVTGLRKSFGDIPVVHGIDLHVDDGKMLVLLGPSGCGKTTTMRCIAGLDTPEAGRISIGAKVVFDSAAGVNVSADKRNVGMVFQSYAIWPHMTVYQNVAFSLEIARTPRAETKARVEAMLELVGLRDLGGRGASQLSGGQMQRGVPGVNPMRDSGLVKFGFRDQAGGQGLIRRQELLYRRPVVVLNGF